MPSEIPLAGSSPVLSARVMINKATCIVEYTKSRYMDGTFIRSKVCSLCAEILHRSESIEVRDTFSVFGCMSYEDCEHCVFLEHYNIFAIPKDNALIEWISLCSIVNT